MPLLPRDLPARLAGDGYAGPGAEADWSGLQMLVLSAPKARRYRPGPDEVCIAIRSHGAPPAPLKPGWVETLAVECDDTGVYATASPEARALTREDAVAVVRFVSRHRHRRRLVIHCDAGVSRSRSMAAALAETFGLPYQWTVLNADIVAAVWSAAAEAKQDLAE